MNTPKYNQFLQIIAAVKAGRRPLWICSDFVVMSRGIYDKLASSSIEKEITHTFFEEEASILDCEMEKLKRNGKAI